MLSLRKAAGAATLLAALSQIMGVGAARADVVTDWNNVLLNTIRLKRTNPPVASRQLAMMQIAVFDAVNSVDHPYQSYAFNGSAPAGTSRQAAAAQAAYSVLKTFYPDQTSVYDAKLAASLGAVPNGAGKTNGVSIGNQSAVAILLARTGDGSATANTPFPGGTNPGEWRPLGTNTSGLLSGWGSVKTFGISSGSEFRQGPPPSLSSLEYAAAYNEVKSLGSLTGSTRTADQTQIADFWSDEVGTATPPGHWNLIAQDVAATQSLSLVQKARMFALMNVAMADAAIACWDIKYVYNLWRPITAIRLGGTDGNALTDADPTWTPFLGTPNFPSYTSGHSTFSAAAANVLGAFFGTDAVAFKTQNDEGNITRNFAGFSDAAQEAADSRLYGGIHFRFDNEVGATMGTSIGKTVYGNVIAASAPEPAALALLLPGILGLGLILRRKHQ